MVFISTFRLRQAEQQPQSRMPCGRLLGETMAESIQNFKIALRFASGREIPALVQKALSENLKPDEIKQAIVEWKADLWHV